MTTSISFAYEQKTAVFFQRYFFFLVPLLVLAFILQPAPQPLSEQLFLRNLINISSFADARGPWQNLKPKSLIEFSDIEPLNNNR